MAPTIRTSKFFYLKVLYHHLFVNKEIFTYNWDKLFQNNPESTTSSSMHSYKSSKPFQWTHSDIIMGMNIVRSIWGFTVKYMSMAMLKDEKLDLALSEDLSKIKSIQAKTVCELKKSFYGLKRSTWVWFKRFCTFLINLNIN